MTGLSVHVALARTLRAQNVDTLFGLMGDSNLFLVDAFVRQEGGRFVASTNEDNGVLMALGHAAMTGRVGAATVTQGPAVSNTLTSLIEGVKGSLPMVLLCGDTPTADPWHPQAVPQRALIEAAGAGFVQLRSPETAAQDLATAFQRAWVERRPVAFNMPTPLMWDATHDAIPGANFPVLTGGTPDPDALEDAVGMIAAARRPIVLAGRGAIAARDDLIALADRIGAPLATTLKAKGLFRGHDYDLGVFGTVATPAAAEAIAAADCIIAFGASLGRFTTVRGGFLDATRLIQIDADPRALGRHQPPSLAMACDPALAARGIIGWLDEAEIASSRSTDTLTAGTLTDPEPLKADRSKPGTVGLAHALDRIEAAFPADRVLLTDGGRFLDAAWKRLSVTGPENFMVPLNLGAIGMGLGHAIGVAHARPDQRTLLIAGDGGLMLGGMGEFTSAVRDDLNLTLVVCNDQAYGAEYVQFEDRQMDPGLSQFNWPSFADMGRAMGARAHRVAAMDELDMALAAVLGQDGPAVIELMLDPAEVPRLYL